MSLLPVGCADDESGKPGGGTHAPPQIVDLVADTNRDGIVSAEDPTEQEGEDQWSADRGAAFLANIDDDDLDGLVDAEDAMVNLLPDNTHDEWDLARVWVTAWPEVPEGAVGTLTLDLESVPFVRVHRRLPDGSWQQLLGDGVGEAVLLATDIAAGVELGVEGRSLVGVGEAAVAAWDGLIELGFFVDDAAGDRIVVADNPEDGVDRVQMRVAPWQMFGNHHAYDLVYYSTASASFVNEMNAIADGVGIAHWNIPYSNSSGVFDPWTEDWFITGFASVPLADGAVHGMQIALPRPYSYDGLPIEWLKVEHLGINRAVQRVYLAPNTGDTWDSGGNHELLPPYVNGDASFPVGRIIYGYGAGVLDETEDFYQAQRVQGPPLVQDTSWLWVGHIDEVFSYVPAATERGWKLLVASPATCTELMQRWSNDGHGATEMFVGQPGPSGGSAAVSIDELLADPDLATWNQYAQARLDDMVDLMIAEIGLSANEIVRLPFWFEDVGGGLLAYHPDTINSMVQGDHFISPDPFGPTIDGADAFKTALAEILTTPTNALGSDGQGLTQHYVDDWDWYHLNGGEVHCATNQEGPPQADLWWEVVR